MANEKKNETMGKEELENATVAANADKAAVETKPEVVEDPSAVIDTDLKVARDDFEYGGETRYNYYVDADIAGKKLKADLISSDKDDIGAFDVFNAFYELSDGKLQFRLVPWTRKAEKKGEEDTKGYTYVLAAALAPDSMFIKVKPKAESDKAIIRAALSLSGYKI